MGLSMAGLTDKEIAATLGISIHTVRTYWNRIRHRVGKETRAEVITEVGRRRARDAATGEFEARIAEADARRAQLEAILGQAPILIWATEPEGHLVTMNDRALNYFGVAFDRLAKLWLDFPDQLVPSDMVEALREETAAARKDHKLFEHEMPLRRYDGAFRWHIVRGIPLFDDQGEFKMRVGAGADIHDLRMRGELTSEREHRLRLAADISERAVAFCDPATGNYYSNPAYESLTGTSAAECSWTDAVYEEDRPRVAGLWAEAMNSRDQFESEHRYRNKNGEIVHARARVLSTKNSGWVLIADKVPSSGQRASGEQLSRLAVVLSDILGLDRDRLESDRQEGSSGADRDHQDPS